MKRGLFLKFIVLALGVLVLGVGCKDDPAQIRPVTITYWTIFDDASAIKSHASEYKKIHPHVSVNVRQVRYGEFDRLLVNALADDVGPDVISVHSRWLKKYQNRLAPMPQKTQVTKVEVAGKYFKETVVTPIVNVMPSVSEIASRYIQTVADDVVVGGKVYGLPLSVDTLGLYYNRELLDKAGIPEPPTTWAEFMRAVEAGTRFDSSGNIIQSGVALGGAHNIDNAPDLLALLMMQNNLDVVKRGRATFAQGLEKPRQSHPALESLRFYTDFARPTKKVYSWNEKKDDALDEFVKGRSVFYFGFAFDQGRIATLAPQMDVGILPVPQLSSDSGVNVANYWVQSVTKKSTHQDEAWDFLRYISSQEGVKIYTKRTNRPSPYRAHIEEQREIKELEPFVTQLLTAKNWYTGRDVDAAEGAMRALIENYMKPYGAKENPLQRDAQLMLNTARIVQQTL